MSSRLGFAPLKSPTDGAYIIINLCINSWQYKSMGRLGGRRLAANWK